MAKKETPMMQQYNQIKSQHADKILFFRMGDFYEMFGDDAVTAAKVLQIQLTARNKTQPNPIPMCGIPFHAYEQYLNKLTLAGYKVALCEQVEDVSQAKGLVRREVVRVVTPGTTTSPELLDANSNCYVSAIALDLKKKQVGIAFCDLSTGEFEVDQVSIELNFSRVLELLYLYRPKEILLAEPKGEKEQTVIKDFIEQVNTILSVSGEHKIEEYLDRYQFDVDSNQRILQQHFSTNSLAGFGIQNLPLSISSAGAVLSYLKSTQNDPLAHISMIRRIKKQDKMILDESTVRNLELFDSSAGGGQKGTIISLIDQTKTPMGARLLRKWMSAPLLRQEEIEERFDAVDDFLKNSRECEAIQQIFSQVGDLERIIARISMPVVGIHDLMKLRKSVEVLPELLKFQKTFGSNKLQKLIGDFDPLTDVYQLLEKELLEEPATHLKNGGYINHEVNEKLDELRDLTKNGKQLIANLEVKERARTKISVLKIKYNRVFGYYIEVSNASKHLVPDDYVRKQTLTNGERYITDELKELEESILTAEDESKALEFQLFETLLVQVQKELLRIKKTAQVLAALDVFGSFAWVAKMNNYTRPTFFAELEKPAVVIKNGRHPVIEAMNFEEPFIPNDLELSASKKFIMLITGPNMGGKSTYMRQVAIIAFLAQIGCYVPAEKAKLTIFDRIFTRVGASDNLTRGQSTFMVEMNEAASILNNATERSLIILDEIGRGTSTFDGISIAWAIAEEIQKVGALTLFATHYHELTLLEQELDGVCNHHVAVKEENENIIFIRKILEGQADKSYGIQVAQLAGLPTSVIQRAKIVLNKLEKAEEKFATLESTNFEELPEEKIEELPKVQSEIQQPTLKNGSNQNHSNLSSDIAEQMSFISSDVEWVNEIRSFDLLRATPLEAMIFLEKLQNKLN
ncbi:MAG: DNA mismatch repair protein MutS [bacterium]